MKIGSNVVIGFLSLATTTFLTIYNISHIYIHSLPSLITGISFIFVQLVWMNIMLNHSATFFRLHYYKELKKLEKNRSDWPKVAIVIPVYKEPKEVICKTVRAALHQDYPGDRFRVIVADDSPKEFLEISKNCHNGDRSKYSVLTRNSRNGYRAGALNHALSKIVDEKYIVVLDADHAPQPHMLKTLVNYMENSDYDIIMFPQYFRNLDKSPVAFASSLLNLHDYFFNRRGKSVTNSSFCVGTNWIGKVSSVKKAGGFYEDSIVEDLASSMILWHPKGLKIGFVKDILAKGLAPESIEAFEVQQYRWAYGTFRLFPQYIKTFKKLTNFQKFDYLNVFIWYLTGLVIVISNLFPLITALGIEFLRFESVIEYGLIIANFTILQYVIFSLPSLIFHKSFSKVFKAQSISMVSTMSYVRALIDSVIDMFKGRKRPYMVTNKRSSKSYLISLLRRAWWVFPLISANTISLLLSLLINGNYIIAGWSMYNLMWWSSSLIFHALWHVPKKKRVIRLATTMPRTFSC